jgi:DNA invertase Pin-like site-specific DNA recombinase
VIRADIYARISSDREGDNLAISRQLADCEQLVERNGWQVVERYVDSDISAYSGKPRPEYTRMLEEIEAGVVEAVLVYHADRLHRHPREPSASGSSSPPSRGRSTSRPGTAS